MGTQALVPAFGGCEADFWLADRSEGTHVLGSERTAAFSSTRPRFARSRVSAAAYINGEENLDKLDRRFAAICQRYDLKPEDYQGRIWIISTRDKPLRLDVAGKGGNGVIAEDVVSALEE
jgi:hypothetical protein